MALIRGYFRGSSPRLEARVALPGLSVRRTSVEFLIDTGADVTVLHRDVVAAATGAASLPHGTPTERHIGAGGAAEYFVAVAHLGVIVADERELVFSLPVRIPVEPVGGDPPLPNILGMDFLAHFRVTISLPEGIVELQTVP